MCVYGRGQTCPNLPGDGQAVHADAVESAAKHDQGLVFRVSRIASLIHGTNCNVKPEITQEDVDLILI